MVSLNDEGIEDLSQQQPLLPEASTPSKSGNGGEGCEGKQFERGCETPTQFAVAAGGLAALGSEVFGEGKRIGWFG